MIRKHIATIFIILIYGAFLYFNLKKPQEYTVLNIFDANKICVDINSNKTCDNDEKFKIYGINIFPEKFGKESKFIYEKYGIKEENSIVLSILSKNFVKEKLLNKKVGVITLDSNNSNFKYAKIFLNNEDFAQILLKNGWAFTSFNNEYKIFENFSNIRKNIKISKKYNYRLKNKKNGKIHKLECEYGKKASNYEIGIFNDSTNLCKACHKTFTQVQKPKNSYQEKTYKYDSENIKIFFLDFTNKILPDPSCSNDACKILLDEINNAQKSIDFAIYGFGNIPKLENAIINAHKKGVVIRFVVDENSDNKNYYSKTSKLKNLISNYKTDYIENETRKFNNFIMHNKYFIIDDEKVWLGSANISETDLSGFNSNNVIFIKSKSLAEIYKQDFETLYNGSFHTHKKHRTTELPTIYENDIPIQIGFSPQDKIISNHINKLIDKAEKSIKIGAYLITHNDFSKKLVEAQKRGVDIKIIIDATSASSDFSKVKFLRENGIKVKIENFAGKMHMKTLSIDDKYFISGSMNFTKSGESYNDENTLIIKNTEICNLFNDYFNYLWNIIPDKYLHKYISAESKESIGSCQDNIDNDYNNVTDKNDLKCK